MQEMNKTQSSMSHVEKIMHDIKDIKGRRVKETSEIRYDSLKPASSRKNTPFMREIYPKQELHK